jgi:phytoene dehydrogenase-like protein
MPFGAARQLSQNGARTGRVTLTFGLNDAIALGGAGVPPNARFVIADRLETLVAAHAAARAGNLPDEPPIEAILTSVSDTSLAPPEMHTLVCMVRPVPPRGASWETMTAKLEAKVLATLDRFSPGLVPKVIEIHHLTPNELGGDELVATPSRMLASWRSRISTPIPGLFLCGADSEPVTSLSGRGGRLAAELAVTQ